MDLDNFPIETDFSKTMGPEMCYDNCGYKDLAWYRSNLPGLPDEFFIQMERVENGELTKKQLRNMQKKILRKTQKTTNGTKH